MFLLTSQQYRYTFVKHVNKGEYNDKSKEFFKKELKVEFVDINTGRRVLDLIAEEDIKKKHPYRNPLYKSDYDLFLEEGDGEIVQTVFTLSYYGEFALIKKTKHVTMNYARQ